ncbi:MAG: hypothetical protein GY810_14745 [Aureispira sp.]|nr:hypothetical protein [Aureispira sp.]
MMKNRLHVFCFLILSTTIFTACGSASEKPSLIGTWDLEAVNGEALPHGKKITFKFQADGIVIRKQDGIPIEDKSQWAIKEENKDRFLHIINVANPNIKEQFKIQKLDANTLIFLDAQETVTLVRQK